MIIDEPQSVSRAVFDIVEGAKGLQGGEASPAYREHNQRVDNLLAFFNKNYQPPATPPTPAQYTVLVDSTIEGMFNNPEQRPYLPILVARYLLALHHVLLDVAALKEWDKFSDRWADIVLAIDS